LYSHTGFYFIILAFYGSVDAQEVNIPYPSFRRYDIDENDRLSPREILRMPDVLAAQVLLHPDKIERDKRLALFRSLPIDKAIRILGIASTQLEERAEFVRQLASEAPSHLYDILKASRASPYDEVSQGSLGEGYLTVRILEPLPEHVREEYLGQIENENEAFGQRLRTLLPQYLEWNETGIRPEAALPIEAPLRPSTQVEPLPDQEDAANIPSVLQREYLVASSDLIKQMQTFGAGPCLIYCAYDPETQVGALAHFDGLTDVYSSLDKMYADLLALGAKPEQMKVAVIGGHDGQSDRLAYELIRSSRQRGVGFIYEDVLTRRPDSSRAVILNLETGEISNYVESQLPENEDVNLRLNNFMEKLRKRTDLFPHPLMQSEGGVQESYPIKPPTLLDQRPSPPADFHEGKGMGMSNDFKKLR